MTDTDRTLVDVPYHSAPAKPKPQRQRVPIGIAGAEFIALLDTLPPVDPTVWDEIERIIEQDYERIDPEEW